MSSDCVSDCPEDMGLLILWRLQDHLPCLFDPDKEERSFSSPV